MASIKSQLRAGDVGAMGDKPTVQASINVDKDDILIRVPRNLTLDHLRESDKSLFAACQAAPPADCTFLVTDKETGKVFRIPMDRKINLNMFVNWAKHQIVPAISKPEAPALPAVGK